MTSSTGPSVQAVITPTPHNAVLVSKDAFKDFTFAESSGISLSEEERSHGRHDD